MTGKLGYFYAHNTNVTPSKPKNRSALRLAISDFDESLPSLGSLTVVFQMVVEELSKIDEVLKSAGE